MKVYLNLNVFREDIYTEGSNNNNKRIIYQGSLYYRRYPGSCHGVHRKILRHVVGEKKMFQSQQAAVFREKALINKLYIIPAPPQTSDRHSQRL